jgi:multiple sugar transport system ATP-binding protein
LHQKLGITTIYVTHDRTEAMTLADRIVVLDRGKIQQIGTPWEIYARPRQRMVATFLSSPPMPILPLAYLNGQFTIAEQVLAFADRLRGVIAPAEGQVFDLGIRAEVVYLDPTLIEHSLKLLTEIELIEPLGKEILLRCRLPKSELFLSLLVSPQWQGRIGDLLEVWCDLDGIFIFDACSGETIYPVDRSKFTF